MTDFFLAKNKPPFPVVRVYTYMVCDLDSSIRKISVAALSKVKDESIIELVTPHGKVFLDSGTSLEELENTLVQMFSLG